MASITDPQLLVEKIDGHPGRRRVVVVYDLGVQPEEPVAGKICTERVVVRSEPTHELPQGARGLNIEIGQDVHASAGVIHRSVGIEVDRVKLDVEPDWWHTDHGGGVLPIAEFVDHLVADVALLVGDDVVATATTPVVTGSWGALGQD